MSSLSLNPLEKPANQPTIEFAINPDPSILHLNFLYDENITGLLEALAKDIYNADYDMASAGKKKLKEMLPCY